MASPQSVIVSPLQSSYLDVAYQLHCQNHIAPWNKNTFSECNQKLYMTLQAINSERFEGYCILHQVCDEVTIMDIAVARTSRRKGIGRKLLQHALDHAKLNNANTVWLEVRASNQAAILLYQKAGFAIQQIRKQYYPTETGTEDGVVMSLNFRALSSSEMGNLHE